MRPSEISIDGFTDVSPIIPKEVHRRHAEDTRPALTGFCVRKIKFERATRILSRVKRLSNNVTGRALYGYTMFLGHINCRILVLPIGKSILLSAACVNGLFTAARSMVEKFHSGGAL